MRVFLACFLTPASARALAGAAPLATGLKPVPAASLHVTLHFIGSVSDERLPEVLLLARELPHERLSVRVGELTGLPKAGRARVLAARVHDAQRLSEWQALLAARWPTDETRSYQPHVTLARSRRPVRLEVLPDLSGMVLELEPPAAYESDTRAEGAVYRRLG